MALSPFKTANVEATVEERAVPRESLAERVKILQPQEVILGLFGEYVTSEHSAWSGGLVQALGDLGFSPAASRVALNRVVARDLLAPTKRGRFVFYEITPRLQLVHEDGRKRIFSQTPTPHWNGDWTVVWYNIPDGQRLQRARLGRWLNLRGFGAIQDGTWIAPGAQAEAVTALASRLGISANIVVVVGQLADGISVRATVDRAWRIEDLTKIYDDFVNAFERFTDQREVSCLAKREAFVVRTRLIEIFRQATTFDPGLPDSVLGISWRRSDAVRCFNKAEKFLHASASAYFRAIAVDGEAR
jgi:phenylacetic acid degradation operon negative regulatory protein